MAEFDRSTMPLDEIVAFVEGRTPLPTLMHRLERDQALQAILEEEIVLRPYTDKGNLLLYVLQQYPSAVTAQVNVRDAMSRFLAAKSRPISEAQEVRFLTS